MTIIEQITNDLTAARKESRAVDRNTLSFLLSEVRSVGKNSKPPHDTTDEEAIAQIRKLIAGGNETLKLLKGTPNENADGALKLQADIRRMETYLPQQLTEAKLTELISAFVDAQAWPDKTAKRVGEVMAHLKAEVPGQFDPKAASAIARTLLGL